MARLRTVKVDRLSLFKIKAKPMLERSIRGLLFHMSAKQCRANWRRSVLLANSVGAF